MLEREANRNRKIEEEQSDPINLKIKYGISASDLQREFGFSRIDAELYVEDLNQVPDRYRRAVCSYVDSMMYYDAYLLKSPQEFADLLNELFDAFKGSVDKKSLSKCVGLHPNIITEILKGERFHKQVDVEKQREILIVFYNLCCDGMGVSIPSRNEWKKKLFDILGLSVPSALICSKYRRQLDSLLQDKNTDITAKELAEYVKITEREFDELRYLDIFDDCYEKREAVFWHIKDHYSFEKAEKEMGLSKTVRDNAYFLSYLEYKLTYKKCTYDSEIETIVRFQSLPKSLQIVITSTMSELFSFMNFSYFDSEKNMFAKYQTAYPTIRCYIPERSYIAEELKFYHALIEAFGNLDKSEQRYIFDSIRSRLQMNLPAFQSDETSRRSSSANICFYFAVLAGKGNLIEKYKNSPVYIEKPTLNNKLDKCLRFDAFQFRLFEPALNYNSVQWKLWGMLLTAIDSKCDISDIIQKIPKLSYVEYINY